MSRREDATSDLHCSESHFEVHGDVSVKWSTLIGIAVGSLLPVPLVLIIGTAILKQQAQVLHSSEKSAPVLEEGVMSSLQTFGRSCWKREDCEFPLGCLYFAGDPKGFCGGSTCQTDLQCDEGWTCQTLRTLESGPLIRTCVPVGSRKEGEACVMTLGMDGDTCVKGLRCNGGWCGRTCELDESMSCPEGSFCREGLNGPSCVPTCEGRTCAQGQQCVPMEGGASVCVEVLGENCRHVPCPEGQRCSLGPIRYKKSGAVKLKMACVQSHAENEVVCSDAGPAGCQPRHP